MMSFWHRIPAWCVLGACCWAVMLLLWHTRALTQFEHWTVDWRFYMRGTRTSATKDRIVLAMIDDHTLAQISKPLIFWGPEFGAAISRCYACGASAVGLDMLQPISLEQWLPDYDRQFAESLAQSPNTVLISIWQQNGDGSRQLIMPTKQLQFALQNPAEQIGFANLTPDTDGCIRTQTLIEPVSAGQPLASFPARLATRIAGSNCLPAQATQSINYVGPPHTFSTISFSELTTAHLTQADHQHLSARIKGKIVLIGVDYTGSNDFHTTPFSHWRSSRDTSAMSGLEIHANTIATQLDHHPFHQPPLWLHFFTLLIIALSGAWIFLRLPTFSCFALLATGIVAWMIGSLWLFQHDYIISFATPILLMLLLFATGFIWRFFLEYRERRYIFDMLGRFVSRGVAQQLIAQRQTFPMPGKRETVTVLVADIRNFTTFCEHAEHEAVVELLNEFFQTMVPIILRYQGTVDKYIGDAIMAVFGAPLPFTDHTERAVCCAIEMRQAFVALQAEWLRRDVTGFAFGVGLHCGPVIAGQVGTAERMDYSVLGHTVNLAFRIESANKELNTQVLVSEDVVHVLGPLITVDGPYPVQVKKTKLSVYQLLTTQVPPVFAGLGRDLPSLANTRITS